MPTGVIQETDSYSGITLKEQSLVMSFIQNEDCNSDIDLTYNKGGIMNQIIFLLLKKT